MLRFKCGLIIESTYPVNYINNVFQCNSCVKNCLSYQKSFDTTEIFYPTILKYLSGSHMSNPIVRKFVIMCYE